MPKSVKKTRKKFSIYGSVPKTSKNYLKVAENECKKMFFVIFSKKDYYVVVMNNVEILEEFKYE